MMAERVKTILPKLNFEDSVEVSKIYSVCGLLENGLIRNSPFRNPHYSITKIGMLGGGRIPKMGEITLSHKGVLFLDELLEFDRDVLESLRIPIENKTIHINRYGVSNKYPCDFILIACTNPCKCGYFGSNIKNCTCTEAERNRYVSKLSGPVLDRFDIQVNVNKIKYNELFEKEESSQKIKERIIKARKIQENRYKKYGFKLNSELTPKLIDKYCILNEASNRRLENVYESLGISLRGYIKILKVARTIADLDEKENIEEEDVLEAIQYRCKEKNE